MKTKEEMIDLAKDVGRKQQIVHAMGMLNSYGKTPEEKLSMAANYRVAIDELCKAERAYGAALATYEPLKHLVEPTLSSSFPSPETPA